MRPIYETAQDRAREQEVHTYIMDTLDCDFVQTGSLGNVDGFICYKDGRPAAAVEIKTRKNASDKYPTYMLSANKWRNGLVIAEQYNIPFVLIVRFTDGIFAVSLGKSYKPTQGGRYDRGDAKDIEECIYIPMEKFHKI